MGVEGEAFSRAMTEQPDPPCDFGCPNWDYCADTPASCPAFGKYVSSGGQHWHKFSKVPKPMKKGRPRENAEPVDAQGRGISRTGNTEAEHDEAPI